MPFADLRIHPLPNDRQSAIIAGAVTDALEAVAGKRREVTAVRIDAGAAACWTIAGEACVGTTAYVDVKITEGTNSREEKAALIARLHRILADTLGELAEASYIVIHELPAQSWGYAGLSQAARAGGQR
ncbi:MAG: tautomerase family protein [Candidatus Thiodiazotropha sp.]